MVEYENAKNIFIYLTVFTFAVALYLVLTNELALSVGFISIAVACISITLGIDSKRIGEESKKIALKSKELGEESDKRVNNIANSNFLRVIGQIEDNRLELYDSRLRIDHLGNLKEVSNCYTIREINTWKNLTYIRESEELLQFCNIKKKYRNRLISLFNKYIELISVMKPQITIEELHHIFSMYEIILTLNVDKKHKTKAKKLLKDLMDENEKLNISIRYIKKINTKIVDYKNEAKDNERLKFTEVIDKLIN